MSNPLYTEVYSCKKTDFYLLSLSSALYPKQMCFVTVCDGVVMNSVLQEEQKELDEITAKRQKKGRNEEESPAEEKTILHGTVAFEIVYRLFFLLSGY